MKYRKTGEQFLSSVDAMTTKEYEELYDEAKSEGFGEPGAKLFTAADLAKAREEGRREGRFEAARIVSAKAADAGRRGYIITAGDGTAKQLDDYLYNIHDALLDAKEAGE